MIFFFCVFSFGVGVVSVCVGGWGWGCLKLNLNLVYLPSNQMENYRVGKKKIMEMVKFNNSIVSINLLSQV